MHIKREEIITEYCDNRNINLTIIRPTLVYGPGDTHNGYGPNKFIRDLNSPAVGAKAVIWYTFLFSFF